MDARILKPFVLLFVLIVASSCEDSQLNASSEVYLDLPAVRYSYNNFEDTTNAISTLGRVLFYDKNLSANNTIACASCHKQAYGFADNQKLSPGFGGKTTTRNSLPIQNLQTFMFLDDAFFPGDSPQGTHLFWDGREQDLQKLVLQPIGNHIEMGIADAEALTKKISALPYYTPLFNDAFGSTDISADNVARSIATFCRSINTGNSRLDKFNAMNGAFNSLEIEGMLLFQNKYDCNACHQVQSTQGYAQFGGTFANVGLDKNYSDPGLQDVTGNESDNGKFKIPSLRNVAYTAPYMHDGRFATLSDVLEHYSLGIANHPNLDDKLKDANGNARSMDISQHEKDAIIAFLHTLSDESVLTDPKFSNPFKTK